MKIGIIGFGHLGEALVKGLLRKGLVERKDLYILARSDRTREFARENYQVQACHHISEILERADILFWVLPKPAFQSVSTRLECAAIEHKTHVSLMAGISIAEFQKATGAIQVTRAMPNIAIDRASGVIGYTKTSHPFLVSLFHELGYAFEIEENEIEKVTAFSACGLGFAAYILEAFQDAGESLGFSRAQSGEIVNRIFCNALEMGPIGKPSPQWQQRAELPNKGCFVWRKGACRTVFARRSAELIGQCNKALRRSFSDQHYLSTDSAPARAYA